MTENAQPAVSEEILPQLFMTESSLATTPTILAALQSVPTPQLVNLAALISGDSGDNTISGGAGNDPMEGLGGDDRLSGGQGDDMIAGDNIAVGADTTVTATTTNTTTSAGNDSVLGAAGNDSLAGDALAFAENALAEAIVTSTSSGGSVSGDTVAGGSDNDVMAGDALAISDLHAVASVGNTASAADALAGDDSLRGNSHTDVAAGDALAISDGLAEATVENAAENGGSAGNDTVRGDGSADAVAGDAMGVSNAGQAIVVVHNEVLLDGSAGNDVVDGQGDKNIMAGDGLAIGDATSSVTVTNEADGSGSAGNDSFVSGDNSDTIAGDALIQGGGTASVSNLADGSAVVGSDTIDSGNNNDLIAGDVLAQDSGTASVTNANGGGADLILAGNGDDKAAGDALSQGGLAEVVDGSDDTLYGGDGADTLSGDALGLGGGTTSVTGGGDDLLYGGAGDDVIYGDANGAETDGGDDALFGDEGNDVLYGNSGDDSLTGGAGDDILYGGEGVDTAFFSGHSSAYQVTDLGDGAIQVTDLRVGSPDGTDIVYDVENLEFSNGTYTPLPIVPVVEIDHLLKVLADGSIAGDLDTATASVSLVSDAANGSLTLNADGTYSYVSDIGFSGVDSFTYLDGGVEHTVRIEVGLTGTGSAVQANTTVPLDAAAGGITGLEGGGYLVSYYTGLGAAVRFQRFDAAGEKVGGEIVVDNSRNIPDVTALADGGFLIAHRKAVTSTPGVQIRRYDADGNEVGTPVSMETNSAEPSITALQYGGYVLAWQSASFTGRMRVFDQDGNSIGDDIMLNGGAILNNPAVLALSGGGFVVSWIDSSSSSSQIVSQHYDSSGILIGPEKQISVDLTMPVAENQIDMALLGDGTYVVTWAATGQDGDGFGIVGRIFDAAGDPLGGVFQVSEYAAGNQLAPSVATLPGGGFIATWESASGDGDGGTVFARQFDAQGNPIGDEFIVTDEIAGTQHRPHVTMLADGRVAFDWSESDGNGDGVFTRIMSLGTDQHDNIQGDGENDYLLGFGGNDVLMGNGGDDILIGGAGADTLVGGSGSDVFVYDDIVDAGDLIDGFDATGVDSIDIDGLLDSLGVADVDRSSRVEVQQAGAGADAVIAVDTTGDAVFDTVVATVTNVTGDLDQTDLNLGTLV